MGVVEQVKEEREEILRIAEAHGASRVRVFGSVVRGTAGAESDLDLLIKLEPGRSLFDLVAIKLDIEDLRSREVHIVTKGGVSPHMREEIFRDAIPL